MATLKSCDRCGVLMKPPVLSDPTKPDGDSVTYIAFSVEAKPWSGLVVSPMVSKIGDYCETCTQLALSLFSQFGTPPESP
jgi:hypothetical protein